jgi:hypothetical protein
MMSNLRPGTETVSHLVSGDNEEQRGQILAVCLRGAIPRLVLNSPSESVARMIEFVQLINNVRFTLPLSSLFHCKGAHSKPLKQL